jgi:peptidyl-prolyl cis-trans isomerase SurA
VAHAEIFEEVVVRVNDAIITRSELQKRRADTVKRLQQNFEGRELETNVKAAQERLLLDMINEELLVQQAELTYDMDKYYERLRRDFMKINEVATEAKLAEMLEQEGTTLDEFRRLLIRSNVPPDVVSFEVTRKLSVSPQEVQDYYDTHRDEFAVPGEVALREIVILDQDRGNDAARAMVDAILSRIAAGEAFASVAETQSESPSREKGGLVGPYAKGELAPALEAQAFALPVGSVGEPIETSYGFHLIQVESRTDATFTGLEDVRDDVNLGVRQQKFQEAFDAFMTELWARNRVVLNPRYATGGLEDGGPYSTREVLLPASNPMGPPPPASAAPVPSR